MRLNLIIFLTILFSFFSGSRLFSQEEDRRITTALDFLRLNPDARSGGLGDIGTTTSPDVYSQGTNSAKYAFIEKDQGFAIAYTPWLSNIVNDVYFLNLFYYNKLSDRGVIGASINYFTFGQIEGRSDINASTGSINANNLSIDASYSLKLTERFSMSVTARYIRSDLLGRRTNPNIKTGNAFGLDISGYYKGAVRELEGFDGQWSLGFSIRNIGPKIDYGSVSGEQFQPTNLSLGAGYKFGFDGGNSLTTYLELDKLLVPTPEGSTPSDDGAISGIFSSFSDAPDGFGEEIRETQFALALEYEFKKFLALRSGYHHEDDNKGGRQFFTVGLGLKHKNFGLDFAYLIPASNIKHPLENSLRISLSYEL